MSSNGKPNIGIFLAVPTRGEVKIQWALNFRDLAMPLTTDHVIRVIPGLPVAEARNVAMQEALRAEAEFLIFLDDDVVVGNHAFTRMIQAMRWNPEWDLLTGIVTTKNQYPEPCIFRDDVPGSFWDWKFPDQFEIDVCGMALCIIRLQKVKDMAEPWFAEPEGYDDEGVYRGEGEDTYFCRRLKAQGGVLMADGGLLAGHLNDEGHAVCLPEDSPPIKNADPDAFKQTTVLSA